MPQNKHTLLLGTYFNFCSLKLVPQRFAHGSTIPEGHLFNNKVITTTTTTTTTTLVVTTTITTYGNGVLLRAPKCSLHSLGNAGTFAVAPSRSALEQRLNSRGQDDEDTIRRRLSEAVEEMSHYTESDFLVINNDFELALTELHSIVNSARLRTEKQVSSLAPLLQDLLN